jgi:hypothetical protein
MLALDERPLDRRQSEGRSELAGGCIQPGFVGHHRFRPPDLQARRYAKTSRQRMVARILDGSRNASSSSVSENETTKSTKVTKKNEMDDPRFLPS